jgi:hypothetical protein
MPNAQCFSAQFPSVSLYICQALGESYFEEKALEQKRLSIGNKVRYSRVWSIPAVLTIEKLLRIKTCVIACNE